MPEPISLRTILKIAAITIGAIGMVGYIIFQARYLIIGPQITLTDQPPFLQNQRQVHLIGNAHNIARLWLNDRQIFTDAKGNFTEALILENGYTVATLRAEDRYGRTTTYTQPFVYIPASFMKDAAQPNLQTS